MNIDIPTSPASPAPSGSSSSTPALLRVLCVDDEPRVLDGLKLHLRNRYEVLRATSSTEGLEILHREKDIAVVISDMLMPVTDGASFLRLARDIAPDAARILLTGHSEPASGAEAVNSGQICAYLIKPCAPRTLLSAVAAAASRYRLNVAQRLLIEGVSRDDAAQHGSSPTIERVFDHAVRMFGCRYAALGLHDQALWPPRRVVTHNLDPVLFMPTSLQEPPATLQDLLSGGHQQQRLFGDGSLRDPGLPSGHPQVSQLLAVPLGTASRRHGWMYFADSAQHAVFTADDARAAAMLARVCTDFLGAG